jgi:O-methyltransferase involved in polyketide biosynthesis
MSSSTSPPGSTRDRGAFLPASLRWIDVDLPAMLEYKAGIMGDVESACRYEAIPADLVDAKVREALFSQIGRDATRALAVTEGLLIHLTDEQVAGLATELHRQRASMVARRPREPSPPADHGEKLGAHAREEQRAVPLCAA